MKIEWLNAECTEAIVTRGWWRWKRQAHVKRDGGWFFAVSGRYVSQSIIRALQKAHERAKRDEDRRKVDADWTPVRRARLPEARLIDRSAP